jgi:hypothetical protein
MPRLAGPVALSLLLGHALAAPPAAPVDPATVKKTANELVTRWLEAQNAGATDAYLSLYDLRHFRGYKRTLRGATRFDGKGWAADRRAMMRARPTVAVERITIETWLDRGSRLKPGIVRVRFLQRWRSARYADHGTKVLDLLRDPSTGALRILYEDLLNSEPGWEDRAVADRSAPFARVRSVADARAAFDRAAPTAGSIDSLLASVPEVPQVRRLVALAAIEAADDLACTAVVREGQCGEEVIEWATLDPALPWTDPCVRRQAALWALEQGGLGRSDLERVSVQLGGMFELRAPERELPKAILQAVAGAGDELRLTMLAAAVKGGHVALADQSVEKLGPAAMARAASELHLDHAALALALPRDRAAMLAALVDGALAVETRARLLASLEGEKGAPVADALRTLADEAEDCALAMSAALALETRGDPSRLPRWRRDASDDARARALCMLLHDSDSARAEKRWKDFLPARGKVLVTEQLDDDFAERDEAGNKVRTEIPDRKLTRRESTLGDLDEDYGKTAPSCAGGECKVNTSDGYVTLRFEGAYLAELHRYRWRGCPC